MVNRLAAPELKPSRERRLGGSGIAKAFRQTPLELFRGRAVILGTA